MSKKTKKEVLEKLRRRYLRAGKEHRNKLINDAVELLGYHRKAAIRALNRDSKERVSKATGRPLKYHGSEIMPVLRRIWQASNYPCSVRLRAMMPEWLAGYQEYQRSVTKGVEDQLLQASARTLDRLLHPLRFGGKGRSLTRPGSLLRQQIPIRGSFLEEGRAGWLEVDTVALCGGSVAGDFIWMVDAVDYATAWVTVRAIWNRGQESTLEALKDMERTLPFPLLGLDSDNGGEFLNYHVLSWFQKRERPVFMTRSRPYKKDDNAHVEQKNWTHVRQWFGYERYENREMLEPMNELARGSYSEMLNYFHASLKLKEKVRDKDGGIKRVYEKAQTPLARVLASPEVSAERKEEFRKQKSLLNPFALKAEVDRKLVQIEKLRRKKWRMGR